MKKTTQAVIMAVVFVAVAASSVFADVEAVPITDRRAVQIAKGQVAGKLFDVERESNMIEVRITKRGELIEIYIDERTGEVMMIENHATEFESGNNH